MNLHMMVQILSDLYHTIQMMNLHHVINIAGKKKKNNDGTVHKIPDCEDLIRHIDKTS